MPPMPPRLPPLRVLLADLGSVVLYRRVVPLVLAAVVVLVLLAGAVLAHTVQAPDGTIVDYEGLRVPDGVPGAGASCCNRRDCGPVEHRWSAAVGTVELLLGDEWVPLPWQAVLPSTSPDGRYHVCVRGGTIRCVWAPLLGS